MRITYRNHDVVDYWEKRWSDIPADHPMENTQVYPLKYAEQTIKKNDGRILEAGCGAGRVLRYYHNKNFDIIGIDYIQVAVDKLKEVDPLLQAEVGDITNLHFDDHSFKYILAFGLYHNLERDLDKAIKETYRVLEIDGYVCASFRADNLQTKITDWYAEQDRKSKENFRKGSKFHKMNLTLKEFTKLFTEKGFNIESIEPVENMPFLYKFSFFRSKKHKLFDENIARSEGYCLSWFGQWFQSKLMYFFPNQFCNIYVLIAKRTEKHA